MRKHFHTFKLFLQAVYSSRSLAQLQERRGLDRFLLVKRNRSAIIIASALLVSIVGYLLSIAWQRTSIQNFIDARVRILSISQLESNWQVSPIVDEPSDNLESVYKRLIPKLENIEISAGRTLLKDTSANSRTEVMLTRIVISPKKWEPLLVLGRDLVVAFPYVGYKRAALYVNGKYSGLFMSSSRIGVPFEPKAQAENPLTIDILFQDESNLKEIFQGIDESIFVTTVAEYRGFLRFAALGYNTKLTWLSDNAVIVMALFLLILFLFVDSSTETLGMAIFLGFYALELSFDYGWLPFIQKAWAGTYANQMGTIFRLYFVLQISRVVSGKVLPWFIFGNLIAIPYAILTNVLPDSQLGWTEGFEAIRDITFCLLSVTICIRVAIHLRNKQLPWRMAALLIAAVASLHQILDPLEYVFPELSNSDNYTNLFYVTKHASVILLAISAFVNISSLENRVRTMSALQAKEQVMNKELELAQSVQTAFMTLPEIPEQFDLATQHDAQISVSGDSYFVDWNMQSGKFSVILNDVTGHGIQAALKASVCQVVAKMVWEESDEVAASDRRVADRRSRILSYESKLRKFFASVNDSPDVVTFIGCEVDQTTGVADLYRVNFTFPYLVSPVATENHEDTASRKWDVELLSIANQEITKIKLRPGSFLVLMSDGYIGGSRDALATLKLLRAKLHTQTEDLKANHLKEWIMTDPRVKRQAVDDDKTLIVLQWKAKENQSTVENEAS